MVKEDAGPAPAWSALTSATNLNKPFSLYHLNFQVTGTEAAHRLLSDPFSGLQAIFKGERSDVAELRINVTQKLSLVSIT